LLREIAWFEQDDPSFSEYERSGWVREIPIRRLAQGANMTVERATEAARELAKHREGVSLDGDDLILSH
jgi:hypothetical protein